VSEEFAAFMQEVGLETLLDNIDFRNADALKDKVQEWQEMKKKQKEQQPDPEMMKAQAIQQQQQQQFAIEQAKLKNEETLTEIKAQELAAKSMLDTEQLIIDKEKLENEKLSILQKSGESQEKMAASVKKAEAEEARAAADLEIKHASLHLDAQTRGHTQAIDVAKHHHDVNKHEEQMRQSSNQSEEIE